MMEKIHLVLILLLIISAFNIFIANNPVHSVLFLILSFCISAIILLMFGVEFLGLIFIMVYVGAVAVLFLFVVMMVNTKKKYINNFNNIALIFLALSAIMLIHNYFFLNEAFSNYSDIMDNNNHFFYNISEQSNLEVIGQVLFNNYNAAVLLAGYVLLIALIGGVCLTIDYKDSKKLDESYNQLSKTHKGINKHTEK
jgi:NADH-quinone oxidoreductase subunit J